MKQEQCFAKAIAFLSLFTLQVLFIQAQPVFPKATMVNAKITPSGKLVITASKTSSQNDFNFLTGKWKMYHQRLKSRFTNCTEWEEFESSDENYGSILNGVGNMDIYKATLDGKPFEGLTVRLFNPATKLWSLYWAPSNTGIMDPPVVGSFEGNIGTFYCKDIYNGKPVLVMFRWDKTDKDNPVWSQAFSPDNGLTWEWNWTNVSRRIKNAITWPQPLPDSTAITFLPGIISKDSFDFNAAFSPDGRSYYFSRSMNKQSKMYVSHYNGTAWGEPVLLSPAGVTYSDADPAFAPDGKLYFISNRPKDPSDALKDYDIYSMSPLAHGSWSQPEYVQAINTDSNEYYISFAKNGNLYFASSRHGSFGEEDIYVSRLANGQYTTPENLGAAINTAKSEYDPGIAANEDIIVFASSGRADGFGAADLYYSKTDNNKKWRQAANLGKRINTPTRDFCPYFAPGSTYFFFSSDRDIKWIDAQYLFK